MVPIRTAFGAKDIISFRRSGTRVPRDPMTMPTEEKLAKPHKAYSMIFFEFSDSVLFESSAKAKTSFKIVFVAKSWAASIDSAHGMPIANVKGAAR